MATLSEQPRSSTSWQLLPAPAEPDLPPEMERMPMPDEVARQGLTSGWVSTGFGLFQLLAPHTFLRAVGMPYPAWLIRTVGARDLALGLGLLAEPAPPGWRTTRFVGDVLDAGLIGAAALLRSTNRRRLAAFALLAGGVILLDALTASTGRQTSPGPDQFDI